jgi:hypothetical protein
MRHSSAVARQIPPWIESSLFTDRRATAPAAATQRAEIIRLVGDVCSKLISLGFSGSDRDGAHPE